MNDNPYQQELEDRLARRGTDADDVQATVVEVDRIIERYGGGMKDQLKDILRHARQGSQTKTADIIRHTKSNTDLQRFVREEIKRIKGWHKRNLLQ